jgi:glycerol-3-phosphate dehydrogenase
MAERTVDMVVERMREMGAAPAGPPQGTSEGDPLSGGDMSEDVAGYAAKLAAKWQTVPREVVERLVDLYGGNAERIVEGIGADPTLGERLAPGSALTRAEVEYVVRGEFAATVEDVLERRTRLFLFDADNGVPTAPRVAAIMGRLLGWDAARVASEAQQYEAHVQATKAFTAVPAAPALAAHA